MVQFLSSRKLLLAAFVAYSAVILIANVPAPKPLTPQYLQENPWQFPTTTLSASVSLVQTATSSVAANTDTEARIPVPATTSSAAHTEPIAIAPPEPVDIQPPPAPPVIDPDVLNEQARQTVVNILCTAGNGGPFNPLSGSGVIIDSRGVIMTNAHVGQYFLLSEYLGADSINCIIRTGSPAKKRYTARLLYISPRWIEDNAEQIVSQKPTGTGEHDYAFLLIDGTANTAEALPQTFPALTIALDGAWLDEQLLLVGYPASLLGGITIQTNLYASSAFASVKEIFVFGEGRLVPDLFSVGGTVLSQAGSSGGAAVRLVDGALTGMFVTAMRGDTTGESDLRAITLHHINQSLAEEGQGGIIPLLSGNLAARADLFQTEQLPLLAAKLIHALSGGN